MLLPELVRERVLVWAESSKSETRVYRGSWRLLWRHDETLRD